MVTVIARYRAKPGEGDAVAGVLQHHVAATRSEPGCIQFEASRSVEDPDEFVLFERYEDEAAFESHRASPHFHRYILGDVVNRLAERTWQRYATVAP
jgi:quinol monooxygenase YgiN